MVVLATVVCLGAYVPLHIIIVRVFVHQVLFVVINTNIDIDLLVVIVLNAVLLEVGLLVRAELVLGFGLLTSWLTAMSPMLLLN